MRSTADGVFRRRGRLGGEGKWVRRKIFGVGGESGLRRDPQRKELEWEVMGCRKNGKAEDKWRRWEADCRRIHREKSKNGRSLGAGRREGSRWMASGGERTADGSAEKGAKIRGVATQ